LEDEPASKKYRFGILKKLLLDGQGPKEEDCIYTMCLFPNAIQRDYLKIRLLKKAS